MKVIRFNIDDNVNLCTLAKRCLSLFSKKVIMILFLLVLTACSTTTGPVVIRESSTPVLTKGGSNIDADNKVATAQPVSPNRISTTIPLVEKLIAQSNQELDNKNYEQAINLAERGLRINRKEPRLYLALSKSYKGEGNRQQSMYFAKQGLRYAEKDATVYRELFALLR